MSFDNRPDHPMKSEIFVKLVTENELRKDTIKKFYSTVKNSIPEGILNHYEVKDADGNPAQSYLVHRVAEDGHHEYEIPLYRNLTSNEIYEAATNLNRVLNEGDFLFETSSLDESCCPGEDGEGIVMEPDIYERFAERIAERMHNTWMHERMNAGWRYGRVRCDEQKTHPLIRSWGELNEDEKHIDYDLPQFFVELLEEFNYNVVSNEELDEMLNIIEKKYK